PTDALMPPADIERVRQTLLVVGAGIEQDRQRGGWVYAGARRVERELTDRDAHAAGALVAESQNALAIGDHDHLDRVVTWMAEDILDDVAVRIAQKQPARTERIMAEFLAAFADRRRIDERQRLFQVAGQQRVEQRLVLIL